MPERDLEHFLGRGHFEVEGDGQARHQLGDILVADVAAVLAQVGGDPVGSRLGGEQGRAHRIGEVAAARVPDGRDMVDVDAETEAVLSLSKGHAAARLPGFVAGMDASSGGRASAS